MTNKEQVGGGSLCTQLDTKRTAWFIYNPDRHTELENGFTLPSGCRMYSVPSAPRTSWSLGSPVVCASRRAALLWLVGLVCPGADFVDAALLWHLFVLAAAWAADARLISCMGATHASRAGTDGREGGGSRIGAARLMRYDERSFNGGPAAGEMLAADDARDIGEPRSHEPGEERSGATNGENGSAPGENTGAGRDFAAAPPVSMAVRGRLPDRAGLWRLGCDGVGEGESRKSPAVGVADGDEADEDSAASTRARFGMGGGTALWW